MERAYIHPATGVGPHASDIMMLRTVSLTPRRAATARDVRSRNTRSVSEEDPCPRALLGLSQCGRGADHVCCMSVETWARAGCWCAESGRLLMEGLPSFFGRAMLIGVSRACGLSSANVTCGVAPGAAALGAVLTGSESGLSGSSGR